MHHISNSIPPVPPQRGGYSDVRLRPGYLLLGVVTIGFMPHIGFASALVLGLVVFASTVYLLVVRRPLPKGTQAKLYAGIAARDKAVERESREARRLVRPPKPKLHQIAQAEHPTRRGSLKQRTKIAFSQKQG